MVCPLSTFHSECLLVVYGLGSLFLQSVGLTGTIPMEVGRLTKLGEFALFGCTDATDLCPCRCADLLFDSHHIVLTAILLLNGNQVSGSIPTELGNLSNIARK